MARSNWMGDEYAQSAERRILRATEELIVEVGLETVRMADIAEAAQCSRATLYRYFPTRTDLLQAYISSVAARIIGDIAHKAATLEGSRSYLTEAIMLAIRDVRGNPALMAWFESGSSDTSTKLGLANPIIESGVLHVLSQIGALESNVDDATEPDRRRAQWVVRVVTSFLIAPGRSDADEYEDIDRFITPLFLGEKVDRASE